MSALRLEQVIFVAALGALAVAAGLSLGRPSERKRTETGFVGEPAGAAEPPVPAPPDSAAVAARWVAPMADGTSNEGFDLFTTPLLIQEVATGAWRRGDLAADPGRAAAGAAAALELVGLVPQPYRLQLIGFAGESTECVGVFENRITGEVFLARAPHELPELGLRIERVWRQRHVTRREHTMPLAEAAAAADVVDLETGERVALSTAQRVTGGVWHARLMDRGSGRLFDVPPGAEVASGALRYRVQEVRPDPPAVLVQPLNAGARPESEWLHVAARTNSLPHEPSIDGDPAK